MPVARCVLPEILVRCIPSRTFPKSVVKVTSTSGLLPPMLISPTDDSGFDWVLALKMILTASACASHLEGLYRGLSYFAVSHWIGKSLQVVAIPATFAIVHTAFRQLKAGATTRNRL